MESFKTLINALRALLGGLDAKIADVKGGLARVWYWIDGLAWVARSTTIERLPETTVHFEGTWNGDQQITASLGATINTTGFTPGQQYTVYYDGKPYSMYYYVADGGKAFVYDLDNLAYGGDFMLAGSAGEWAVRITGGVSGEACDESHTFYIPAETKTEEKLPDVFLDMDWIPKAQVVDLLTGYVLAEHEEDIVYSESEMVRLNRELFEIIEGEKYTVIWGGGTYSCTGLSTAVDSLTIPFIGNASIQDLGDDTGEPFLICKYPDEYASMGMVMAIFAADKETLTALASSPLTVRQTKLELPEDMLPSSVKAEIAGKLDAKNPSGEGYFEMNPFTDLDTGKRVTPGEGSFNVGWRGSAEGRWATNIGSGSAAGGYSVCIGSGEAKAYESTAIGGGITEVNDENDSVSEKNGHHSIAIGVGATAARPYQVVVGKYNVINDFDSKDEYIYILGKGSFIDERSNAHTIDNKGNGWFSGEVYVGSTGGVNRDEGSVKLLKDGGDGNGTSLTATHTAATSRAALTSGEKLGVALGKIAKWLADLGSLAFKSTVGKSDLDTELTEIIENSDVTTKLDKVNPTGSGALSINRDDSSVVGEDSAAVGFYNTASGAASFAEGNVTVASGVASHAEGFNTTASESYAHAEGYQTTASESCAHAEGYKTKAGGRFSHAEGDETETGGYASHAEGNRTIASGGNSHAEGERTTASGGWAHAEGFGTTAGGEDSHAEGLNTTASGNDSHAEGYDTKASSDDQHVQGRSNIEDATGRYAHIVGNGDTETRSNAHTLDWKGNGWFAGKVYVGGTSQDDAAALDETVVKYSGGSFYTADGTAIDVDLGGGGEGGGSDVVVDEALNSNSTNPVQNKAINAAIAELRTTANNAANTASSAASTASTASTKADAAQTAAGNAKTAADNAKTAADNAKTAADNAKTAADNAAAAASNAQTTADEAKTEAREAKEVADEAGAAASSALVEARSAAAGLSAKVDFENPHGTGTFSVNGSATGQYSAAIGLGSAASGDYSVALGRYCAASGLGSHAEGGSATASGVDSHAEGNGTKASSDYQHVQGKFNVEDTSGKYAHIVGGGQSDGVRKNIHTLDWDGNGWFNGTVECAGIIMTSPDGTRYKVTVANGGTLQVTVTA